MAINSMANNTIVYRQMALYRYRVLCSPEMRQMTLLVIENTTEVFSRSYSLKPHTASWEKPSFL